MINTRTALIEQARVIAAGSDRVIVAIVGAPGSGKSTVTEALLEALRSEPPPGCTPDWVAHLPMDGFHLADVELDRLGRRERKGAADTFDAAGYVATLRRLGERVDEVYAPGFERTLEQPIAASIAIPVESQLILTEGLYLLHDEGHWARAAQHFSASWFCVLDPDIRRHRLIERHVRFGKSVVDATEWVHNVDEANALVVERTRHRASALIDVTAFDE